MAENITIVFYNPSSESPRRRGARVFDNIRLNPGRNKLNEADYQSLTQHPDYKQFSELGAIKIISNPIAVEEDETATLSKLKAEDAIALIQSEYSLEILQKWQLEEGTGKKRTSVLNVIALQVKDIEGGNL